MSSIPDGLLLPEENAKEIANLQRQVRRLELELESTQAGAESLKKAVVTNTEILKNVTLILGKLAKLLENQ